MPDVIAEIRKGSPFASRVADLRALPRPSEDDDTPERLQMGIRGAAIMGVLAGLCFSLVGLHRWLRYGEDGISGAIFCAVVGAGLLLLGGVTWHQDLRATPVLDRQGPAEVATFYFEGLSRRRWSSMWSCIHRGSRRASTTLPGRPSQGLFASEVAFDTPHAQRDYWQAVTGEASGSHATYALRNLHTEEFEAGLAIGCAHVERNDTPVWAMLALLAGILPGLFALMLARRQRRFFVELVLVDIEGQWWLCFGLPRDRFRQSLSIAREREERRPGNE